VGSIVGVGFGVLQWQFIVGEQYDSSLVFSLVGSKGRSEDFPVDVIHVVRCPLVVLLEILLKWGKVYFILEGQYKVAAYKFTLYPQMWLGIRYRWVVVIGAELGCSGCILFCMMVTVDIILFNDHKNLVGIFVLMAFNVDEYWFHWCATFCHVADRQI